MSVIVEVPDLESSRVAKRLIGRRTGVKVVVSGERETISSRRLSSSESVAKILVRESPIADAEERLTLIRNGVLAVIPSDDKSMNSRLRDCVDSVRSGLCPLLSEISNDSEQVTALLVSLKEQTGNRPGQSGNRADNPLSRREAQILQQISEGVTSREIAAEMGFQLQTVKNIVTTILTKTQARSRTHAVSIAQNQGWISGSR